jgi:predicted RNase H-like nuclease (RuvC/YqgF family)
MDKQYLSISEFAEIKGITPQAVYKQLNNKLKDFLIEVESKKYIKIEALSESELKEVDKLFNNEFNNSCQEFNNQIQPFLEKQIEEKDKQIERLFQQIEEKDRQIENLQNLLSQSQQLQAIEKQLLLENQKKKGIFRLFGRKEKEIK